MDLIKNSSVLLNHQIDCLKQGEAVKIQDVTFRTVDVSEGYAYANISIPYWADTILTASDERLIVSAAEMQLREQIRPVALEVNGDFANIGGIENLLTHPHMLCEVSLMSSIDSSGNRWFNCEIMGTQRPDEIKI